MDKRIIANIRTLGIDMIHKAESGHPGIVLGAAPILYTVFARHMHINKNNENWMERDRFVLSAGHGSALLYATLYMAGLGYTYEDLKHFRQMGANTTGHPEYGVSPFVEATTGPLGQGIAMATGMALGAKMLGEQYRHNNEKVFDYHIYVLCGDGDLMEGISSEAISFAGTHKLNNLIVLYDANQVSLDGKTNHTFTEDVLKKCEACHWNTIEIVDGEDVEAIDSAICQAKNSDKPTLIKCNTVIGKGSILEGQNIVHGKPLAEEDIKNIKRKANIIDEEFFVDIEAKQYFEKQIYDRSIIKYEESKKKYNSFILENPDRKEEIETLIHGQNISLEDFSFPLPTKKESTRVSNGNIMGQIASKVPLFIGGSADLSSSTMTYLKNMGDVRADSYQGKNIWFGVREHAMGAILNGLALTHFKPFGSTFLVFSDYLRPAIRLSALMHLPVFYIFTHDSIEVGEDGPTHQPIEQLASLRAIPNVEVFRPCDAKEIVGAWKCAFERKNPTVFALSRGDVPQLINSSSEKVAFGAYIIQKEKEMLNGTIVASGTEVSKAIAVADKLYQENLLSFRVVSMPSLTRFKKMDVSYQREVLGENIVFVMEAASSFGLESVSTSSDTLLTIDTFGKSGKKDDVVCALSYTVEQLKKKILDTYRRHYEK